MKQPKFTERELEFIARCVSQVLLSAIVREMPAWVSPYDQDGTAMHVVNKLPRLPKEKRVSSSTHNPQPGPTVALRKP